MKMITVNKTIRKIVNKIIKNALEYERVTGRKLGITGEIGEILVCDKFKLNLLVDPLMAGYDAMDKERNKYQIKSKRIIKNSGCVGSFAKYKFDYLIMILLDKNYKVIGMWKTDFKSIYPVIKKYKRRNPSVREIKNISDVW